MSKSDVFKLFSSNLLIDSGTFNFFTDPSARIRYAGGKTDARKIDSPVDPTMFVGALTYLLYFTFPFLINISNDMFSTYTIAIPTPDVGLLQQLAQFRTPIGVICVYWQKENRQAVFEFEDGTWCVHPDGHIVESLGCIMDVRASHIVMRDLFLFEYPGHGKLANDNMQDAFYECEWSDYANDHISIQAIIDCP